MNTPLPLVSVVVPAYNSESFIKEAIDSVLNQDYPAIEVLVIDDGSTDSTPDIIRGFGDRVRLISQNNKGSAAARNMGIISAKGKYIAFLDADDVWRSDKISLQVAALMPSGYKMAYSSFIRWYPNHSGQYPAPESQFSIPDHPNLTNAKIVTGWTYSYLLLDCIVWTSTVIVEKAELEKVGLFDEHLRKGQDYDLWLRLSRQIEMLGIPQPMALYRMHNTNITSSVSDINYSYLILSRAIEKWGETGPDGQPPAGSISDRMAHQCFVHGYHHLLRGNPSIAADSFYESMKHSGIQIKPLAFLTAALAKSLCHLVILGKNRRR